MARVYNLCRKPAACRLSAEKALIPTPGGGVMSRVPNPARRPPGTGAGGGAVGDGETGWGSAVSWMDVHPLRPETPRSPSVVRSLGTATTLGPAMALGTAMALGAPVLMRVSLLPLTNLDITPSPDGNEEG